LQSTVVATKEQISSELKDEAVVLDLKAGAYYGLAGTGPRIWNLIQQPRKVIEIRDTLVTEYDVPREVCEKDLLGLLQELASKNLIEVRSAPAA
jgi:shikimate kinase